MRARAPRTPPTMAPVELDEFDGEATEVWLGDKVCDSAGPDGESDDPDGAGRDVGVGSNGDAEDPDGVEGGGVAAFVEDTGVLAAAISV